MRKLYLVPIVLIAMIAAPNVFARDLHAPCHYSIKPSDDKPKHGVVTCYACNNIDDFSNVGAAHTVNNHKYDSLDVKNGNKVVRVKSDTHYVERGITINLGPFIGWNWERHDRSHQSITSYMVSGSVSGRPWNSYPISDEAALAKCEAIPEEEKEAIEEMKKKAEEEQSNDASSGSGSPIPPIDMQLQMQAALREMIRRGSFEGWHYRGGVFGPAEFLRPCDGFYTADGSGTRCYKG